MARKKRILLCNETSEILNTGFSVIGQEIFSRLLKTDKIELFELGSYVAEGDPRLWTTTWDVMPVMPHKQDQEGHRQYNSDVYNQFGKWKFEEACLKFLPDIVVDLRDIYMSIEWQSRSPFWNMFKSIMMVPVDSQPPKAEWVDSLSKASRVISQSRYGDRVLRQYSGGLIQPYRTTHPGVNTDLFKPAQDKSKIRDRFGLSKDANIIGFVARLQKRKLFPDLLETFDSFIRYCIKHDNKELAEKTFLYLHSSYPDIGYDIGKYILRLGLGHKVLVTHYCRNCGFFYPSFFAGEISFCKRCNHQSAIHPNTDIGLTREQLVDIYQMFDLYVQFSVCEGLGIPIAEAASCEVPCMVVNYSAMEDFVEDMGPACIGIDVKRFFHESVTETEQRRALPDNEDAVKKIYQFFKKPREERLQLGQHARKVMIDKYSFDQAAKAFEETIDSLEIDDWSKTWHSPQRRLPPFSGVPQNLSNYQYIDFLIVNCLGQPNMLNSAHRDDMVKGLNMGYIIGKGMSGQKRWTREIAMNEFLQERQKFEYWEQQRVNTFVKQPERTIQWNKV